MICYCCCWWEQQIFFNAMVSGRISNSPVLTPLLSQLWGKVLLSPPFYLWGKWGTKVTFPWVHCPHAAHPWLTLKLPGSRAWASAALPHGLSCTMSSNYVRFTWNRTMLTISFQSLFTVMFGRQRYNLLT